MEAVVNQNGHCNIEYECINSYPHFYGSTKYESHQHRLILVHDDQNFTYTSHLSTSQGQAVRLSGKIPHHRLRVFQEQHLSRDAAQNLFLASVGEFKSRTLSFFVAPLDSSSCRLRHCQSKTSTSQDSAGRTSSMARAAFDGPENASPHELFGSAPHHTSLGLRAAEWTPGRLVHLWFHELVSRAASRRMGLREAPNAFSTQETMASFLAR